MGCYHSCWLRCVNNWEAYKVYFNSIPPPPLSEDRNYVNKFNISLFDFLQWNSQFSLNIRFLFPLNVEFGVSSFFFLLQNIEFALGQVSSSQNVGSATQHSAKIQEELRNLILKRKARNEEVFEWIDVSIRY